MEQATIDRVDGGGATERLERVEGAIVVGAGPAGLATSHTLDRAGVPVRILERSDRVGSSWHEYYEGLRLNSPRWLSSLPGARIDRGCGRWPNRNDVILYLERYARRLCPEIDFGVDALRIDRHGSGWRVETSNGPLWAPAVVIATGINEVPVMPAWPGRDSFPGELIHSREYANGTPYIGKDVLVVGSGMSGSDISLELLAIGAKRVRMSIRTPPIIFRPQMLGLPSSALSYMVKRMPPSVVPLLDPATLVFHKVLYGDLSSYGLEVPPEPLLTAMTRRNHGVTTDRGFVAAVKRGELEILPAVEGFDGADVLLAGGERVQPDVVIAATGQRPALEKLIGHLGVLGEDGRPLSHGGRTLPSAPDVYFIGYRLPPGQMPDMARDARAIARRVVRLVGARR